jgi:hypothetical protein
MVARFPRVFHSAINPEPQIGKFASEARRNIITRNFRIRTVRLASYARTTPVRCGAATPFPPLCASQLDLREIVDASSLGRNRRYRAATCRCTA